MVTSNIIYFVFKRPAVFVFLEHTQGCLGRSHCCIYTDFSSDYGPETKRAKKRYRTYMSLLNMIT